MSGLELVVLLPLLSPASVVGANGGPPVPVIYTEAARYDANAPAAGAERFPAGARLHLLSEGRNTPLIPAFAASADAAVSWDAKRILFSGKQRPGDRWQIWEVALAGGAPRRVLTSTEDDITPFYLPPDRIVFSRKGRLYTAPLAGGAESPLTYVAGNQIVADVLRDGRVLFEGAHPTAVRDLYTVYSDGSGVETHRCDHTHARHIGRELSSGDIVFEAGGKLARFTSARAVELAISQPPSGFAGPIAELPSGDWLVTWRNALYRWTPGPATPKEPLAANAWQPAVVAPRARPRIHPSSLGNREGANTLCLSVYTSKQQKIAPVASVKVWAQDDRGASVALGTAPIEKDGSFFVTTPADRPVRFELLDKAGKTVAAEKGWLWFRRGEQRVCVGCHAGPERATDNVQPQTLLRSTDPVKLMIPGAAQ
ncbi:MAG: hypothetical protein JSU00_25375 [Acidobacteria bacterium]|nr:hypothetical protein [Acidobacteriota bacterium]